MQVNLMSCYCLPDGEHPTQPPTPSPPSSIHLCIVHQFDSSLRRVDVFIPTATPLKHRKKPPKNISTFSRKFVVEL